MAQVLDKNGIYTPTQKEEILPWRQSAPEVLSQPMKFSEKSDVWAFGTLLWLCSNYLKLFGGC